MNTYYDTIDGFIGTGGRPERRAKPAYNWPIAVLCVLVSALLFLVNTRHGIGIFVDSTRYMGVSERPYDAPVYAWMLQVGTAVGFSMVGAAKVLGLLFAIANTLLIWLLLARATGQSAYALAGTMLIILAPQFVSLHAIAMSEPPFLFFVLLTIFGFLRYLDSEKTTWLLASALALGIATLVRFTAPPLGAAIFICIVMNPQLSVRRRIRDVVLFTVVSAGVFFSWVLLSEVTAGRSIGRDLSFYGTMGAKEWLTSFETLLAWMLPDQIPFSVRAVLFLAFAVIASALTIAFARRALHRAREEKQVDDMLPMLLGLFIPFYLAFVILSSSLEANLSLNSRYAFPAYVAIVLMVTIVVADLARSSGVRRWLHHGLVALALVVLTSHGARTAIRSYEAFYSGIGYASRAWVASPTIKALRKLPVDAVIYSNGADAIAYILKRPAFFIPERVQLRTNRENPKAPLAAQLQRLRGELAGRDTYLVFLDKVDWRFYLVTEEELVKHLKLEKIADESDGRIYALPGKGQEK